MIWEWLGIMFAAILVLPINLYPKKMRALHQTLQEIAALTATIEKDYPELYEFLDENPLTIPSGPGLGVADDRFESHLESLKQLLRNHIETHRKKKQKLEELTSQIPYNAERVQTKVIFEKGEQKTTLFAFSKGQGLKPHTAPHDVIVIVLAGTCGFVLGDGEEQQVKGGQIVRIPAQILHSLRAITDFKMVLIK
jgi:quercetin dioxygenase-like cupin family protein